MPPKALFKNKVVAVSGTFPGYKQADLKDMVESNGGTFNAKVINGCTHLISSKKEYESNGTKNKQAAAIGSVDVVSLGWLLDSISSKKCKGEKDYLWSSLQAPAAASSPVSNGTVAVANGGTRRSARTAQPQSQQQQAQLQSQPQTQPVSNNKTKTKRTLDAASNGTANGTKAADSQPPVKKQKEEKKAKKQNVPVDALFYDRFNYHVYIDPDGVIYDAALNQTNRTHNNNKFYFIQVLEPNKPGEKYITWNRWGRVGEDGAHSEAPTSSLKDAIRAFEKKFRDKTGLGWVNRLETPNSGKYMFLERDYEADSDAEEEKPKKSKKADEDTMEEEAEETEIAPPESKLSPEVQYVVGLIFNQQFWAETMATMNYDANKLPLGKLSKRTLNKGFELLKTLADMVQNRVSVSNGLTLEDINNQYFTVIPHALGRGRIPLINNEKMVKNEVQLLEALTDMEIANEILKVAKKTDAVDPVNPLDRQFAGLFLEEMTPLLPTSTEYQELADYLIKTHGSTHYLKYNLKHIFRIERAGENDRYMNSPYADNKNSNRRLLWHGSRTTNYGGILSQGLRIAPPEAPVTGYMFGKGVYFADISSKSANYCCSYNSGKMGLLLLCDVELGDPMLELTSGDYNAAERVKKENKLATLGMGQTIPYGWKDASVVHESLSGVIMPDTTGAPRDCEKRDGEYRCLQYNEYIVYDVAQIRLKYLFCVGMD